MSKQTENQFGPEIQGSPSQGTHSEVIAHLRESTQKIDALERQIAQLYTLLNEKYTSNNNNNDVQNQPYSGYPYLQDEEHGNEVNSPSLDDQMPNSASFLHMRRRKKKRHRKKLLDLRGRVSLTPSIRSASPTSAPPTPALPAMRTSIVQNTEPDQTYPKPLESVNSFPNLLRSNLNMRVINPTTTMQPVHNNNLLYDSDSRLYASRSENPPSPLYLGRSSASSSSDSAVQGEDSDTDQHPAAPRSVRVSTIPPEDNNNNNNTSEFDVTNQPSTEFTEPTTISRSGSTPRELLRKTSVSLPVVATQQTDDNDVEMETMTGVILDQTAPVIEPQTSIPAEEPKDTNFQVQDPSPSPVDPPQQPPAPVERKPSLKSSKIREAVKHGIERARSYIHKHEKSDLQSVTPAPEHARTEQELESELESLLFSSSEGLWDTRDADGAPKLFNISIILENYDDIFSDFDPRPFAVRTVSDDFLDECRRRLARVPNKTLKELGQLALLVPGRKRDSAAEQIIIRRLQQHFSRGYSIQKSQNRALWRRGFIWIVVGMIMIAVTFVMQIFQFKEDEGSVTYWVLALLNIWINPAGSFFFWEGLEHLFFYVRENSGELEFYHDMSKISFQFHTIDASLQTKLKLAYANYRK